MLGKLLKYDFRSMWKQFALIWPAALVLALVNRLLLGGNVESASQLGGVAAVVSMMVYVAILMAMFVIAIIYTVQRFYKGLLGDEGYLMHTLPVGPGMLIASKLICAVAVTLVSVLVAILSILLLLPIGARDWQSAMGAMGRLIHQAGGQFWIYCLEGLVLLLVGMASSFLRLYLAMAIGHLFQKHRVAWSVGAYIALNAVLSALMDLLPVGFGAVGDSFYLSFFGLHLTLDGSGGDFIFSHGTIWLLIVSDILLAAACFAGTRYILRRRLNLE